VEHLGVSDRAVTANRRLLLRAIADHRAGKDTVGRAAGEAAAGELTGPHAVDLVAAAADWKQRWREHEAERRARSPWAAPKVAR